MMRFAGERNLQRSSALHAMGLLALLLASPALAQESAPADTAPPGGDVVAPAPDLAPSSQTECVRGASCLVDVTIENRGDALFDGAAGIRGTFDPAVKVESARAESRGLKCSVEDEGVYECAASALKVKPGEVAYIQVVIDIPSDFAAKEIGHTQEMLWSDGAAGDGNAENDAHVSTIAIIDPAMLPAVDLALAAGEGQENCIAGAQCSVAFDVTNNGPADFDGTIEVEAVADQALVEFTGATPSDWACLGAGSRFVCTWKRASIEADGTKSLTLNLTTGSMALGDLETCAEVSRNTPGHVADIQRALNEAGFEAGPVDGVAGRRTRAAISAYQEANGLAVTGEIGTALLQKLLGLAKLDDMDPDNDRACVTVEIVAPEPAE